MMDRSRNKTVCVPDGLLNGKSIRGMILDSCHQMVGHSSLNRTIKYICRWFWWPSLANNVETFCKSCRRCQTMKTPQRRMPGWLHTMPILSRPWESIGMDFTGLFVEAGGFNYILLVICRMTRMVHLIPTQTHATAKHRLHGILESIVLDRDSKFMSQFWNKLSKVLGQRLLMLTAYHPQTDGLSERAIQMMSQVL